MAEIFLIDQVAERSSVKNYFYSKIFYSKFFLFKVFFIQIFFFIQKNKLPEFWLEWAPQGLGMG